MNNALLNAPILISDVRLKFLTALMIIVLSISIAITVLRFGVSVLQDNFVAELSTNYGSSVEFLSFYSLLNFYMVTMAYVYAPPKRAFFGKIMSLFLYLYNNNEKNSSVKFLVQCLEYLQKDSLEWDCMLLYSLI